MAYRHGCRSSVVAESHGLKPSLLALTLCYRTPTSPSPHPCHRLELALKARVVSAVNTDYAGFVALSSKIEGFEASIHHLKPPLLDAQVLPWLILIFVNLCCACMSTVST